MRLVVRLLLGITLLALATLVVAPPLIGLGLEKYANFANIANVKYVDIEVVRYKRGWFSSDVTFRVKSSNAELKHILENVVHLSTPLPSNMEFLIEGHIQHGPVFYTPAPAEQASPLGLALMTRTLVASSSSEPQNLFQIIGIDPTVLRSSFTYLSFTGRYLDYIDLQNIRLLSPAGIHVHLNDLKAAIWSRPDGQQIKGHVTLSDFRVSDDNTTFFLPDARIHFNVEKDPYGLWIGKENVALSRIDMHDDDQLMRLSGIKLKGGLNEREGFISGIRKFHIQAIEFESQPVGSVQLEVGVIHVNAKAISDLIDTYQDILQNGEMYEFQLKQRMLSLIPGLVSAGTMIQLENFIVQTPDGQLQVKANLAWPKESVDAFESVEEMMQPVNLKADFRLSLPLANRMIGWLAKLTYIYQLSDQERQVLINLQDIIRMNNQANAYTILDLIAAGELPKEDGIDLLTKMRGNISLADYAEEVKNLLFVRKIDLQTSHKLIFLYTMLDHQYDDFDQQIALYQKETEHLIQAQIDHYIAAGLVARENNEYKVVMTKDQSKVIVNGRTQQ